MTVDSRLLMDIVQAVLTRSGGEDWKLAPGEFWCMAAPDEHPVPGQGWKMHVSATLLAAPIVLAASAGVLVRERCAFKFTRGLKELGELLSPHCERGRGGKFITVYPLDDEQFRRVAHELDQATDGLPGPRVLSDRRLRPGSNVYYRYGVISSPPVLTAEGIFESMLTDPQGQLVKDERTPFFRPPPWAVPPLPQPYPATTAESRRSPRAMVIGGRFVVRAALRHAYRGGVFQATDTETGADVVLKQARPHVMCMLTGEDAQDMLRHEAHMCELLGPLGLAPRKIALVPAQENLFLAEEWIPGDIMPLWVQARASGEWQGGGRLLTRPSRWPAR